MSTKKQLRLKKELLKRLEDEKQKQSFKLEDVLFDKQLAFVNDASRFKTAVCSRRAGKSHSCAADLLHTALTQKGDVAYFTLSRNSAKRILWRTVHQLIKQYNIPVKVDNTELTITFENGNNFYVSGAKDASEAEKIRGLSFKKVYLDECFHGDTLIETKNGLKPIKDVQIGDIVRNAYGFETVTSKSLRKKQYYVSLIYNGAEVKCSLNHPFFTKRGWVFAKDLTLKDELVNADTSMYILQQDFSKAGEADLQILQQLLLHEKNSRDLQPDVVQGISKESKRDAKAVKAQTASSRREWTRSDNFGAINLETLARPNVELFNWIGQAAERVSDKLQGGFGVPFAEISNRSGRKKPWSPSSKKSGPEKRGEISFSRLDGHSIQESASDATNPDGHFYDIGVKGHPSFVVNGVLVHNCQSFRSYIKDMVEDIIEPALTDYNGSLILIGTPGPVPAGYFYDASHNNLWSHHHWTMVDNPHIKLKSNREPIELIKELAQRRGLTVADPSIQREFFGQWIKDDNSLVLHFDPIKNVTLNVPQNLNYIFGIDIGWNDADAISVVGYSSTDPSVYLVEEVIKTKQTITELVDQIKLLEAKYKPIKMIMDAGALGKKIQEEIRQRFSMNIAAAEKQRKHEFLALLDDSLRTGQFKAVSGTRFEEDCNLVQWNFDDPAKPKISDAYHSDAMDSTLYAFREAKHFAFSPVQQKLNKNSNEYMQMLMEQEAAKLDEQLNGSIKDFTDVNSWDDLGVE